MAKHTSLFAMGEVVSWNKGVVIGQVCEIKIRPGPAVLYELSYLDVDGRPSVGIFFEFELERHNDKGLTND